MKENILGTSEELLYDYMKYGQGLSDYVLEHWAVHHRLNEITTFSVSGLLMDEVGEYTEVICLVDRYYKDDSVVLTKHDGFIKLGEPKNDLQPVAILTEIDRVKAIRLKLGEATRNVMEQRPKR